MSFMFNPYPYRDPMAYNTIDPTGIDLSGVTRGSAQTASALLRGTGSLVGIDGYATAPFHELLNLMGQEAARQGIRLVSVYTGCLWRPEAELDGMLGEILPNDLEKDPTLLYGKLFEGGYEDLMDPEKLQALQETIRAFAGDARSKLVVFGPGSLCPALAPLLTSKVWLDVTPLQAVLNLKEGRYTNIGVQTPMAFKQIARRCYFVDFELAQSTRMRLLGGDTLAYYVAGTDPRDMTCLPIPLMRQIFRRALEYPLRNRPIYLEGVWGGYYFKQRRHLPKEMKNCAWVFDMIPMEVSTVLRLGDLELEFPFYCLVQAEGERLMGRTSLAHFGPFFPIRFNYDDTYHGNGNMSIQCHPGEAYIRAENNELGRQDESYYVVDAAQGARTYLGFHDDVDVEGFIADIRASEKTGSSVDYEHYVDWVESKPGVQVMIPGGTIHSSGRNQIVLEIGSLTVGSYTYKLYDYLRADLDGTPRPLHSYHGDQVLNRSYRTSWVRENLVQERRVLREGEGWQECIVGEHELLYFSLRNFIFVDRIEDDTKDRFHVLSLVDGEEVLIRSKTDPSRSFRQKYLDIVVLPASFGPYEILNLVAGSTVTIHKTLLKDGFEHEPKYRHAGT